VRQEYREGNIVCVDRPLHFLQVKIIEAKITQATITGAKKTGVKKTGAKITNLFDLSLIL